MKKLKSSKTEPILGVNNYVDHSMAILDRIHELLDEKFGGKKIELAKVLGKKDSEISKWFSGVQNFTIFTISKLEEAFGEPIIAVHSSKEDSELAVINPKYCQKQMFISVDINGMVLNTDDLLKNINQTTDKNINTSLV